MVDGSGRGIYAMARCDPAAAIPVSVWVDRSTDVLPVQQLRFGGVILPMVLPAPQHPCNSNSKSTQESASFDIGTDGEIVLAWQSRQRSRTIGGSLV